jgi:DNA-binding transcriptional ArsR family regulator
VRRQRRVYVRGALDAGALSMARRAAKSSLPREALEIVAQRFRALGDPTRLALLQALFEGDRTVQELCALTGTSQANASKHLALLLERGLVTRQRDGLFVRYGIADSSLERLCHLVCGSLAEHHESVRASLPT